MNPVIKQLPTDTEIREKTENLLGDADEKTIRAFVELLENFKDEDSETCHLVFTAQKFAFSKTPAFERNLSEFMTRATATAVRDYSPEEKPLEIGEQ